MVATDWLAPLVKTLATRSSNGLLAVKGSAEIFGRPCGNSMELASPREASHVDVLLQVFLGGQIITRSLLCSPGLWLSDLLTLGRVDQVSMVFASLTKERGPFKTRTLALQTEGRGYASQLRIGADYLSLVHMGVLFNQTVARPVLASKKIQRKAPTRKST